MKSNVEIKWMVTVKVPIYSKKNGSSLKSIVIARDLPGIISAKDKAREYARRPLDFTIATKYKEEASWLTSFGRSYIVVKGVRSKSI